MALTADQDREDVQRVLAGAVEDFAILVDRHQGRIVAHLTRLVGRDEAEDLAQDTFLRAYQALDRYDPTYPFRGWLLVISSRLATNHLAKRREHHHRDGEDGEIAGGDDPAHTVADADAHAVLVERIDRALATLAPESRSLYELRFRQELTVGELARHFHISESALKVRVHRLRATLAERLGITLGEP